MKRRPSLLVLLTAVYCTASLAHFVHNAEYLSDYPNLPEWLSRSVVYVTWLAITAIGTVGLFLLRGRHPLIALVLLLIYAAFGFDGLGHYALAPMSAHSAGMNITIWAEVLAAALLFTVALGMLLAHLARIRTPKT